MLLLKQKSKSFELCLHVFRQMGATDHQIIQDKAQLLNNENFYREWCSSFAYIDGGERLFDTFAEKLHNQITILSQILIYL